MKRITDLGVYLSPDDATIRMALGRLNATDHLFQLVVDDQSRLIGTVTDGDIRRALLHDINLDRPVVDCMFKDFVAGRFGDDVANTRLLKHSARAIRFLPVIDERRRVREVLMNSADDGATVALALVMAGGRGSRLGSRTRTVPKPLVCVGGKPMLEHVLERLESAGVSDVFVSTHYLADQIEQFCTERRGGARLHLLRERERGGTAGAVGLLPAQAEGNVIVINADVLTAIDLRAFVDFHESRGHDVSIAVAHHVVQIPYGVVRADADGRFQGVDEKPSMRHFVAAGIYVIGPSLRALVPAGRSIDMPELLNLGRAADLKIGVFPIHEYWRDVGRPDDLAAAETDVQQILR